MSSLESLRRGAMAYLSSMVSKEPSRMLINVSEHCPVKQTELAVHPGMHTKGQLRLLEKESSTPQNCGKYVTHHDAMSQKRTGE